MNFYAEAALKIRGDLDNCIDRLQETYFSDKSVPLSERWDVYEKVAGILPIDRYGQNAIEGALGNDISLYDDFNIERYQTVRYVDQIESLESDFGFDEADYGPPRFTQEQIDSIKELVLASGTQGFIHNW